MKNDKIDLFAEGSCHREEGDGTVSSERANKPVLQIEHSLNDFRQNYFMMLVKVHLRNVLSYKKNFG